MEERRLQLRGERLVWTENQRRPIDRLDDFRDRECLSGAGDAEEDLVALVGPDRLDELADRLGLIALRLEGRNETELGHAVVILSSCTQAGREATTPAPEP